MHFFSERKITNLAARICNIKSRNKEKYFLSLSKIVVVGFMYPNCFLLFGKAAAAETAVAAVAVVVEVLDEVFDEDDVVVWGAAASMRRC